jgi:potassium/hydrogen antiporter
MADTLLIVFGAIGIITLFGYFAEYLFEKTRIQDVLFLIALGIGIGPFGVGLIDKTNPNLHWLAPLFTSFALLFLVFDGSLSIDLISIGKGVGKGLALTLINFFISVGLIAAAAFSYGYSLSDAILFGMILGGISSAFVIPIVRRLKLKEEVRFALTLESALTDVLCIVGALTVAEVILANDFTVRAVLQQLFSIFGIATLIGVIGAALWILLIGKVLKLLQNYMLMIGYLLLLYVITEYLGGNGAIAGMVFGVLLGNSRQLIALFKEDGNGFDVTTVPEKTFYSQITFFLKTFFFVYIGILLDFSDWRLLAFSFAIALVLYAGRQVSLLIMRRASLFDRKISASTFARGLAAAAIAGFIAQIGLPNAEVIVNITFSVIMFTIILSSTAIFYTTLRYSPAATPSIAKEKPAAQVVAKK